VLLLSNAKIVISKDNYFSAGLIFHLQMLLRRFGEMNSVLCALSPACPQYAGSNIPSISINT
jgi:hypothetical protein